MVAVPGINLLNMALRVIAPQSFTYSAFNQRTLQPNGLYVTGYADPVAMRGSVQAVPRNLFQQMGLDFQKDYRVFYISQSIIDVTRDVAGDKFVFGGDTFKALSVTPWFKMDGWDAILTSKILPGG